MTNRWFLLNFDTLGGLAVLTTTLLALSGYGSAGTAGLCITSAMTFTMSAYWARRFWTARELDLKYVVANFFGCSWAHVVSFFTPSSSIERVVEYL
jgi:hypothetical protein